MSSIGESLAAQYTFRNVLAIDSGAENNTVVRFKSLTEKCLTKNVMKHLGIMRKILQVNYF